MSPGQPDPSAVDRSDVASPRPDSQSRLRLLIESVRDYAIFMLDPDGKVVSWNLGAERIKGYRAHEIIGSHFSRFYPQDMIDKGWPQHELEVARREGRFEDEGWRIRRDGTRFWANVIITALVDGGELVGFSKITRDLTERRRHEEELRESEERFRLLVEGVQDYAMFMLDPGGHIISWNVGAERIKGYTAQEIIGSHFSRFYPEDALDRGWPEHELAMARRDGRFEDEGWRLRKDGTRFWANVVITAIYDPDRTLRGFAKVTRDLTERRRIEALEEEGRRINEFLAMLGHELRNPLAPIRNAVSVLEAGEGTDARATSAREIIGRQVAHLGRIVDDLLDVGRINTGKISIQHERLDLASLIRAVVDTVRGQFDAKGVHLEVTTPSTPLHVLGDPTRLSQVVLNLLANAQKYTPAGGHVRLELTRDGRFAQLCVADDGIGMPPELLPRIFDLFVQGERGLDRGEGGLGIGLTLVRRLVELQGGTVSASSKGIGHGSEFTVRLPTVPEKAGDAAEGGKTPPATAAVSRRVLVVDDNQDGAESLAVLLGFWGHDARVATDGPQALAAAAEHAPDVVLLDIGLPGMSGYAVAERLRGSGALLIATTGYGRPEDAERAKQAGFAAHLVKPVDPERLKQILADLPPRKA
jgi:PAS domain S-box-containing protein